MILLVTVVACGKKSSDSNSERKQESITDMGYFNLVNQYRAKLGLRRLQYSPIIEAVAYEHSDYMADGPGRFGHFGWRSRCKRLRAELRANNCGEIVARGQHTAEDVLLAWLSSPPHRASIENPEWTHTGVGIAYDSNGRAYWTQMFLKLN